MRILALQLKRIGDLVLTVPALQALKTAAPDVHLTLVQTAETAPLLPALGGCVDQSLVYRPRGGVWPAILDGEFDVCVDFTGRDRSAVLTLASRAAFRVVARDALRRSGWRRLCYNTFVEAPVRSRHTVDFYLEHVEAVFAEAASAPGRLELTLPPSAGQEAEALLRAQGIAAGEKFIVIHPGSARPEKYWVAERWAEVIDYCQGTLGRRCVLTGGKGDAGEQAHLARIHAALRQPCADLSGQLDLLTLAAVLARAAVFAGVDSGPMHLAAAFGRPQVVLFGPTNPFHWRPRHSACLVLQAGQGDVPVCEFQERSPGGRLDAISTAAVIDCIRQVSLATGAKDLSHAD